MAAKHISKIWMQWCWIIALVHLDSWDENLSHVTWDWVMKIHIFLWLVYICVSMTWVWLKTLLHWLENESRLGQFQQQHPISCLPFKTELCPIHLQLASQKDLYLSHNDSGISGWWWWNHNGCHLKLNKTCLYLEKSHLTPIELNSSKVAILWAARSEGHWTHWDLLWRKSAQDWLLN